MKTDFEAFPIGYVHNPLSREVVAREPVADAVTINYPSRLEAMALDPSKIADNNNLMFPAGQIDFCIDATKRIEVVRTDTPGELDISPDTSRQSIVRHAASIMLSALKVHDGLSIRVDNSLDLRHCGLGSSSSLVAGVAAAINELYGKPVGPLEISRYCAQNHGEEIDDDSERLIPVQCIGGSAICGHFEGSLVVIAGQAVPIHQSKLSDEMKVVIGVPEDYTHPDAEELMKSEEENMDGFRTTGAEYGREIAYRLTHEVLPGFVEGNLKPCKDLIFDYRWDMGSIRNCSFVYPPMNEIAESLRDMKDDERVDIISLSSVGPGFFALTKEPDYVAERFNMLGMRSHHANLHDSPYTVARHVYA